MSSPASVLSTVVVYSSTLCWLGESTFVSLEEERILVSQLTDVYDESHLGWVTHCWVRA